MFRKKLIATHIHDNHGRGEETVGDPDSHLLPFEGNFDYAKMMRKLDEYEYAGALTLEVGNDRHKELSPEEFLQTCFERLQKISEM